MAGIELNESRLLSVACSLEIAINCLRSSMKRPGQSPSMLDRVERTILLWIEIHCSWENRELATNNNDFRPLSARETEITAMGILQFSRGGRHFGATNDRKWLNLVKKII